MTYNHNSVTGMIPPRQMQLGQWLFIGLAYGFAGAVVGLSLVPGLALTSWWWDSSGSSSWLMRLAGVGLCLGWGYFLFGLSLLGLTVAFCRGARLPVREGDYPFFSITAARWVFSYLLTLAVQTLFLPFMRSTPLICLWYRGMGATIGPDVQINTCQLNDASLLEFGDGVLVGADALIICHATEGGILILRKTRLSSGSAIGAGAVLMPGVTVGSDAVVLPGSVVPPNSRIPAGEVWGGVPAQCLKSSEARSKVAA
ncbi:MAG: hypothetical protein HYZ93_04085 [Candidatus Omnitrophica bacterium]|nr:hypothetical protein [Candidatus Omnitrophota bacterium]